MNKSSFPIALTVDAQAFKLKTGTRKPFKTDPQIRSERRSGSSIRMVSRRDFIINSARAVAGASLLESSLALAANNPSKTPFHCHRQDQMDSGFMMLFDYA